MIIGAIFIILFVGIGWSYQDSGFRNNCHKKNNCVGPYLGPVDPDDELDERDERDVEDIFEWLPPKLTTIQQGDAVILTARPAITSSGLFSVLDDVWSLLRCYEIKLCSAVKVDFGKDGLYYDPKIGENWYNYYFKPIDLGDRQKDFIRSNDPSSTNHQMPEFGGPPRDQIAVLVHKYIIPTPAIQQQVNKFVKNHFRHQFVFGVHYRGTDKTSEAPRTPYEVVSEKIRAEIAQRRLTAFKIFVATDEAPFIKFLESEFPGKIIYDTMIIRSTNGRPLHINMTENQYTTGRDALIDCLLLSRTNFLFRTSSNLSRWATYFNPKLPVEELSQRHEKKLNNR
ncbi:MAG: nodulation protein NodZ [Myxococcota bacterium]